MTCPAGASLIVEMGRGFSVGGNGVFFAGGDVGNTAGGGPTMGEVAVDDGGTGVNVEDMAGVGDVHALTRLKRVNRMMIFAISLENSFIGV